MRIVLSAALFFLFFVFSDGKFNLQTVLLLADQLLSQLEFLHSKNVLHLDLKPQDFLMGTGICFPSSFPCRWPPC